MKINRIITIGLFLAIVLFGFSTSIYSAEVVTLNSPGAGNLQLSKEALTAMHLKVTGEIDARDFKTLKSVTMNRTRILDLSEAQIVSYSGDAGCYAPITSDWMVDDKVWYHTYEANTLPIHAFAEVRDNSFRKWYEGSTTLRRLILPATLKNIEYDAFRYNDMLTEVITPENAEFLTSDGHMIYTLDNKKLVAIAPAYTGSIDIPATVEEIDSCAFSDLKLAYVSFNSENAPQMKGSNLLDAACVVVPDIQQYAGHFDELDCVEEVEEIVVNNLTEDNLLLVLGNMGYRREDVREIRISGELSQDDINDLISLPNLHKADLSQATTTATNINIDNSLLCSFKFPSGTYDLSIGENNYLEGELIIPEGVRSIACFNTRFSVAKFPSTLIDFVEDSFNSSVIREADFSNCTSLVRISGFYMCANLEKLLLPPALSELDGVSQADLQSIELPGTLTLLSFCNNWSVDTLRLPVSIKELEYVGNMPNLKYVDLSSCSHLTTVSDCFNDCPQLESIDFSNCPISYFSGFDGTERLSEYFGVSTKKTKAVVSGGTRFPSFGYSGLKSIKFPSSIESLSGFSNCEQLENVLLGHCYRLEEISGFTNCLSLDSVALPSSLMSVCPFDGSHIKRLSIGAMNPPQITDNIENCGFSDAVIWVPNGYSGLYKMSEGWSLCKEINDGGYSVSFSAEGPVCLLNGAGLYPSGETVILSYSENQENQLQSYIVNWLIDNRLLQGNDVSFVVSKNTNVNVTSSLSVPNIELGDVVVELSSTQNASCEIRLSPVKGSGNLRLYIEEGLINEGGIVQEEINIPAGTTIKLAVAGDVSSLSLSSENDVSLERLDVKDKQSIESVTIKSINVEELDFDGYDNLTMLELRNNQLNSLNVSNNKKLESLRCVDNQLTGIDLTANENLRTVSFMSCSSLKSITLPNSLYTIEDYAFYYCDGLTSVSIPDSVKSIGMAAFYGCSGLTSVTIPNSVKSIGVAAFMKCFGLTSVTLPNSVESIGDDAFYNCSGLTLVTIPSSVTFIGERAFSFCIELTAIHVDDRNKYYKSIDGVLFDADETTLIQYPLGNSRTSYVIPGSVISIGNYAFTGCTRLTSVTIPNSVTSIGDYAFNYCSGLTTVTIPGSVTTIGDEAFSYCYGLQTVINLAGEPQRISSRVFEYVDLGNVQLLVPSSSVNKYRSADVWRDFGVIKDIESGISVVEIDNIVVSGGMLHNPEGKEMRIYDLNGREVYRGNDCEVQLPAGLYILHTTSGNRKVVF